MEGSGPVLTGMFASLGKTTSVRVMNRGRTPRKLGSLKNKTSFIVVVMPLHCDKWS